MSTIADLSVTVTDGKTAVVPGVNYDTQGFSNVNNDYTVTVTNNGPDTVTQFTLNTDVGAGVTLAAVNNPAVNGSVGGITASRTLGLSSLLWDGLSLASSQSAFTTFVVRFDPSATGPLTFTSTVIAPSGTTYPNPTNDSFTASDTTS